MHFAVSLSNARSLPYSGPWEAGPISLMVTGRVSCEVRLGDMLRREVKVRGSVRASWKYGQLQM